MHQLRRWIPYLILVFSLLFFTACGGSLQKPTGLEDNLSEETTLADESSTNAEIDKEVNDLEENNKDKDADETTEKDDTKTNELDEKLDTDKNSSSETKKKKGNKNTTSSSNASSSTKQSNQSTSKSDAKKDASKSTASKNNASGEKPKANEQANSKNESSSGSKKPTSPAPKKDTVTISIVISSKEVPLSPTNIEINSGDKVLDVFYKATNEAGIQQSVRGAAGTAYIEGIANVYEFDRGQGSGWMYRINGIFPDRGVGVVPVENGDRIELLYTTDLGKDLNANLQPFRR